MPNPLPPKLAQPALRALASVDVATLEDLSRLTERDVKQLHGMGPNALGKIKAAMAEAGISFRTPSS